MGRSLEQRSETAATEGVKAAVARMHTLELYRMLTRIDGMDFTSSEQPSRDQLLSIAEVLLHRATSHTQAEGALINAILEIFVATNTVLRSFIMYDGDTDRSRNNDNKEINANGKPHEKPRFWELVQKQLEGNPHKPAIKYEDIQLLVTFYSVGFRRLITSGTLQLPKSDKRRLLILAVVEWQMLTEECQCNIQLLPQETALNNKRPRLVEDSDSAQDEDSSTRYTVSPSAAVIQKSPDIQPRSGNSDIAEQDTDQQQDQKIRVLTAHLEQLWERALERSRVSQKWVILTLNALLDVGDFTIRSSFLKTTLLEYSSRNETLIPVTATSHVAERIAKAIVWDDVSAEEERDFVSESSGSSSDSSVGEQSEDGSQDLMSLDGEEDV